MIRRFMDGVSAFIDIVADAVVAPVGRLRRARRVQVIEQAGETFSLGAPGGGAASAPFRLAGEGADAALPADVAAALSGRDVELMLAPSQFLFRPLELPRRATEFLDGIVRSQVDRLTPWTAAEAVFGWTRPVDVADDRMTLTVAATARARIAPWLGALKALGAGSIVVSTRPTGAVDGAAAIRVLEEATAGSRGVGRVRQALLAVLMAASMAATLAVIASQVVGGDLDAQLAELNQRITQRRLALVAARGTDGGEASGLRALERRKHDNAAAVLVIEALSRILPDHTHVTEMHIEGDRLQVTGITREAPMLIRLLEQSSHFTRATFFAPTTRAQDDPGERFHIEARIKTPFEMTP